MNTTRDLGETPLRFLPRGGSALLGILATSLMLTIGGQAVAKPAPTPQPRVTEGSLFTVDEQGHPQQACPLKHTDVKIDVSGFLARATVTQQLALSRVCLTAPPLRAEHQCVPRAQQVPPRLHSLLSSGPTT